MKKKTKLAMKNIVSKYCVCGFYEEQIVFTKNRKDPVRGRLGLHFSITYILKDQAQ